MRNFLPTTQFISHKDFNKKIQNLDNKYILTVLFIYILSLLWTGSEKKNFTKCAVTSLI